MPSAKDYSYADVPSLSGKVILITGANQGLGKAFVGDMLRTDCAKILMACRSEERANDAIEELGKDPRLEFIKLDLADTTSIRQCHLELVKRVEKIDILVLNAALFDAKKTKKTTTKDGYETTMGVAHFGHFLFTSLLWPLIRKAPEARIVSISSVGHTMTKTGLDLEDLHWEKRKYDGWEAYFQAKLANIYFAKELYRRCKEAGIQNVTVTSNSPGWGNSGLYRGTTWERCCLCCLYQRPEKLSINTVRAAVDKDLTNEYLTPKRSGLWGPPVVTEPSKLALDGDIAKRFWEKSEEILNQKFEILPVEKAIA